MIKYKDYKRNHVIMPGREKELDTFLKSSYNGINHKLKNSISSNSEDAITWSCFDIISQLSDLKKTIALDEIIEHSFSDNDMKKPKFSFANETKIKIEVGKIYKGNSIKEQTELDASIETSEKIIFIEAKLYSSISLKSDNKPYDQIAKKIRVGLDYALEENKEFYFIFLDIAPRDKLYYFTSEKKSMENAKKIPTKKWKSVWWFNRYKKGWGGNLSPLKKVISDISTNETVINGVSERMGWLTWTDLFKITMRGMI
ncbi:hypothetical protein [Lutibacter sp. B1]|uniref:hypothetical protein n=1 Tax=Lutibacter sp. B1 TaxID=2725996 RepID=UPI0014577985|nr:hypothetical protein [Lutibacter sp. B1]NLP59424.1 hypothetical protein [Lutibacter sp. B1]